MTIVELFYPGPSRPLKELMDMVGWLLLIFITHVNIMISLWRGIKASFSYRQTCTHNVILALRLLSISRSVHSAFCLNQPIIFVIRNLISWVSGCQTSTPGIQYVAGGRTFGRAISGPFYIAEFGWSPDRMDRG